MNSINTSLAKTSSYYAVFSNEGLSNLKYYLQGISTPSISLSPIEIHSKVQKINQISGNLELSPINVKILLDENLENYTLLLDTIFNTIDQNTGVLKDIKYNLDIFALSNKGNPVLKLTYKDGFIANISEVQYNDNSTDNEILSLDLTFIYTSFEYTRLNNIIPNTPGHDLNTLKTNTNILTTKI